MIDKLKGVPEAELLEKIDHFRKKLKETKENN